MNKEQIKAAVYNAISKGSGIPRRDLKDEMQLKDCSIIDTIDFMATIIEVENELGEEIRTGEALDRVCEARSIGELVKNVCEYFHAD